MFWKNVLDRRSTSRSNLSKIRYVQHGAAPNLVRSGSVLDRGNLAPKSVIQHRSLLRQRSAMDRGNTAPNLVAVGTLRKVGPQPKIGVDLDNEIILYTVF
jgi:hypothetical protein